MAQVSRVKLRDKMWMQVWSYVIEAVELSGSRRSGDRLLEGLLTRTEKVMLGKRLMATILLVNGWEPVAVANLLLMSPPTVYKLQQQLYLDKNYKKFVKDLFPKIVKFKEEYRKKNGIVKFVEDIMLGRRERHRLYRSLNR